MKAIRFHEHGGTEVLRVEDVPDPVIGPGEVLVRVRACALNHLDLWQRSGLRRVVIPMPHISGSDVAGVVVENTVSGIPAGARVMLIFLVVVNTWVLPWYFSWPLALAVVLGWQSTTAKVLLGFSLSAPTVMYYHHFWHPYMSDTTYLLYLAPLLIAPVAWGASFISGRRRTMRRASPDSPKPVRDTLVVADAGR